jgi:type IV pilus biogenesis protein CpaD/CtpE
MARFRQAGAAALLGLALAAGCAPEAPYLADSSYGFGPSQRVYDLRFQPGGADLAAGELARMQAALAALELRQGDAIHVRLGLTGEAELDRARTLTAAAAVAGTPAAVQVLGSAASPLGGGRYDVALVEVVRNARLKVNCPTPAPEDTWSAQASLAEPPTGCTNAWNIAQMAALPSDLIAPRELAGSDGVTSVAAVERYRADRVKATTLDGAGN